MYQPQPMFINPSSMNFSQSPTMTPETINGPGEASTGGSIQASPVHSVSSTYQDQSSSLLAQEKPQNYFSSGHFSSENNLKETTALNTNVLGSTTSKEQNSKSTNKDKDATTKA